MVNRTCHAALVDLFAAALEAQGLTPSEAIDDARNLVSSLPAIVAERLDRLRPELHRHAPFAVVEHVSAAVGALVDERLGLDVPSVPRARVHLPDFEGPAVCVLGAESEVA